MAAKTTRKTEPEPAPERDVRGPLQAWHRAAQHLEALDAQLSVEGLPARDRARLEALQAEHTAVQASIEQALT